MTRDVAARTGVPVRWRCPAGPAVGCATDYPYRVHDRTPRRGVFARAPDRGDAAIRCGHRTHTPRRRGAAGAAARDKGQDQEPLDTRKTALRLTFKDSKP